MTHMNLDRDRLYEYMGKESDPVLRILIKRALAAALDNERRLTVERIREAVRRHDDGSGKGAYNVGVYIDSILDEVADDKA